MRRRVDLDRSAADRHLSDGDKREGLPADLHPRIVIRGGAMPNREKGQAAERPGLSVKLSGGRTTKRKKLFGVRAGAGRRCRRGALILRASSEAQRGDRDRQKHQGFNKFHSVNRPLSEQVAAVM